MDGKRGYRGTWMVREDRGKKREQEGNRLQ
jgi:hypothetical protein